MIGRQNDATEYCNKTIKLSPTSAYSWRNKGYVLSYLGKYDEAINAFNEAIRLDPNNSEFWHHKGIVLKALGRTTEADACLCQSRRRATRV
jgi:Flp pilus assembly protein TadD